MLDENCINALEHLQAYVKRRQRIYNAMFNPRSFNQGDLVLYENQQIVSVELTKKGKISPNWLGPYIIAKSYGSKAYRLLEMDGTPLREPINVTHLCQY